MLANLLLVLIEYQLGCDLRGRGSLVEVPNRPLFLLFLT